VVGLLLLVICLMTTIYRFRVAMFVRFNIHPFDVDECQGEDMTYDVFLLCADEDYDVGCEIAERLRSEGFKLCYHEQDCRFGEGITNNIGSAIEKSKRVVCLLTIAFLRRQFCMFAFDAAFDHCMRLNKRRLGVIKWPEVNDYLRGKQPMDDGILLGAEGNEQNNEPPNAVNVKMFLNTHTYIDHDREDWWQQLIYAMPNNRLGEPDGAIARN
jgi:TIR domain